MEGIDLILIATAIALLIALWIRYQTHAVVSYVNSKSKLIQFDRYQYQVVQQLSREVVQLRSEIAQIKSALASFRRADSNMLSPSNIPINSDQPPLPKPSNPLGFKTNGT